MKKLALLIPLLTVACSTAPYQQNQSITRQTTDNLVRYGSIAGVGTGGYFAGKAIGGSTEAGVAGAVIGSGLAYGLHKFNDQKREDAFEYGKEVGSAQARAETLNEKWKREAVYGLPEEGKNNQNPTYRTVYIPSKTQNEIKQNGQYQTIKVYKNN